MSKYASKEDWAEAMGYDCGRNGVTEANCHFSIFYAPECTKAWERGKSRADAEKQVAQSSQNSSKPEKENG